MGKFCKVLEKLGPMHRSLLDVKNAMATAQPPDIFAKTCRRALALYEQYLKTLDLASAVGIDSSQRRLQSEERKLVNVLWAGSEGVRAPELCEFLAEDSCDAGLVISRLLLDYRQRIKEFFWLALDKIEEAFDAVECNQIPGLEALSRPDHQTRLLAVSRFYRLMNVLLKQAGK